MKALTFQLNTCKTEAESVPSNEAISPHDLFAYMILPNERDNGID